MSDPFERLSADIRTKLQAQHLLDAELLRACTSAELIAAGLSVGQALRRHGITDGVYSAAGTLFPSPSISYAQHIARGGAPARSWQGNPVRPLELDPPVLLHPISGRDELQDGVDRVTGIDWGSLPRDAVAAIAWGLRQGLGRGVADSELAHEAASGRGSVIERARELAAAEGVKPEEMRALIERRPTPVAPASGGKSPASGRTMSSLGRVQVNHLHGLACEVLCEGEHEPPPTGCGAR